MEISYRLKMRILSYGSFFSQEHYAYLKTQKTVLFLFIFGADLPDSFQDDILNHATFWLRNVHLIQLNILGSEAHR